MSQLVGFNLSMLFLYSCLLLLLVVFGSGGKTRERSSSLFKMAIGVIIMGWGFFFMSVASGEVTYDAAGRVVQESGMQWLLLAYLFHTLGELCASPVTLHSSLN